MNSTSYKYLETLDELRYIPIHFKGEDLLYESIIKSFESLGKSTCRALLNNLGSICGLSEKELLTNYELFEEALYNVLGETAERLLSIIKRELLTIGISSNLCSLTVTEILDPSLKIDAVLKDILTNEIIDFLKSSAHKHIAFFYNNKVAKEKILQHFIHPSGNEDGSGIILSERSLGISNSFNILYHELLQENNSDSNKSITEKISKWLNLFNKYIGTTKFVQADGTWWLRNNVHKEWMLFEQILCQEMVGNCASLCCFDSTGFEDTNMQQITKLIIEFHEYVILDEPTFAVYKSSSNRPGINNMCLSRQGDNR